VRIVFDLRPGLRMGRETTTGHAVPARQAGTTSKLGIWLKESTVIPKVAGWSSGYLIAVVENFSRDWRLDLSVQSDPEIGFFVVCFWFRHQSRRETFS